MPRVQFGALYSNLEDYISPVELAARAERWGYDSYWVPDYVSLPPMDPFVVLGAAAQKTKRIKLGTGVVVVPFRSPFHLAKASLSVDVLSQGRMILGVGVGGPVIKDIEVTQTDLKERGVLSDERLDIVRRLFSKENVSYQGKYHRFKGLTMTPRPIQKPWIPIWIGSSWKGKFPEAVLRRTARYGDAFFPVSVPARDFANAQRRVREYAEEYDRDPATISWVLLTWACLGDTREKALDAALQEMERRTRRPFPLRLENGCTMGTIDHCVESVQDYVDIGVTHFVLDVICEPSEIVQQYEALARELLPRFK